jgi:hypothetical protein
MAKAKTTVKDTEGPAAQRKSRLQALRNKTIARQAQQGVEDADSAQEGSARRQELRKLIAERRPAGSQAGSQAGVGPRGMGRRLGGGFNQADGQKRPVLQRLLAQRSAGRGRAGGAGAFGAGSGAGLEADLRPVDSSSTPEEIADYRAELTNRATRLNNALSKLIAELARVDQMTGRAEDADDSVEQANEPTSVTVVEKERTEARTKKKPGARKAPAKRRAR